MATPHRAEPADQTQLLGLLQRILRLERQRGCANDAVVGGLARFFDQWLARWPPNQRSAARDLLIPFDGYADLAPAARAPVVDQALRRIATAVSSAEGPPGPPHTSTAPGAPSTVQPRDAAARTGAPSTAPEAAAPVAVGSPRPAPALVDEPAPRPASRAAARPRPAPAAAPDGVLSASGAPDAALGLPVSSLRGVGPAHAEKLAKLGVTTVRDLLYHFPRRHLDYRAAKLIRDLSFEDFETVLVTVWKVTVEHKPGGLLVIRVILADESGTAEAVWLRRQDYLSREFVVGRQVMLSGECRLVAGRPVFKDPEWESFAGEDTVHTARLVPVYPLVEGLNGRFLRRLAKSTIDRYASLLRDHLPPSLRAEQHLLDLPQAIAQMHYPDSDDLLRAARRRLVFDELLVIQLGLLYRRRSWDLSEPAPALRDGEAQVEAFLGALPFALTAGQATALAAIRQRLATERPTSLLLEGDVGSGKTVVATAAMVQAAANGYQSAIMAPTEILAEQHLRTLESLLGRLGPDAPQVTLLTGSVKGAERRRRQAAVRDGEVAVVVGTQALVQEGVEFARLGLVVVDEQHRFGVAQRSTLRQKGYNPHVLVMTATPIPRTLALTLYGDLELARIAERPPGRQAIKTRYLRPTDRPKAYTFLRREVSAGHQAFVICPLVEDTGRSEARAATAEYERLQSEVFPDLRLGLLHGRLKAAEKEEVMRAFQRGELDVLVSTAVVEVGIDVPNATVMLIEGANRFGLAQLHQFRGRVGRGSAQSYCLLISDTPSVSSDERLGIVERTEDGFALAEADLRLRGPGEFFGTRQSGLPDLKVARFSDVEVLETARTVAGRLFEQDPGLNAPEHRALRQLVARFWQGQLDLN